MNEKLAQHTIHCLPCSDTNGVIGLLPYYLTVHIDFQVTSLRCHAAKILSTIVRYSMIAMLTDLQCYFTFNSSGALHTVYAMLHSIGNEMLPEIHTTGIYVFLKPITHSQII